MTKNSREMEAASMLDGLNTSFPDTTATKKADGVLAQGRGERPTTQELTEWVNGADCPSDAIGAVCDRLTTLLGYDIQPPLVIIDAMIVASEVAVSIGDLWDEYRSAIDAGEDMRWPLAPLVNGWQQRPRPVEPSRRTTERVIPARLAMAHTSGPRNARLLFSPAAHTSYGPDGEQLVMPGFAKPDTPSPALPLALYDLETRPETPMLREMGYSLRRLSTHKWIVGTLCIHHDGEGDNNTSDAQRQKLGKLAFRPAF